MALAPSPMTDFTDEELLDVLESNYYTLATTGYEAVNALAWDIAQGNFSYAHGLSDERMGKLLVMFTRLMSPVWNTTAIDFYKEGK